MPRPAASNLVEIPEFFIVFLAIEFPAFAPIPEALCQRLFNVPETEKRALVFWLTKARLIQNRRLGLTVSP